VTENIGAWTMSVINSALTKFEPRGNGGVSIPIHSVFENPVEDKALFQQHLANIEFVFKSAGWTVLIDNNNIHFWVSAIVK
jgi:hypothetical protein